MRPATSRDAGDAVEAVPARMQEELLLGSPFLQASFSIENEVSEVLFYHYYNNEVSICDVYLCLSVHCFSARSI